MFIKIFLIKVGGFICVVIATALLTKESNSANVKVSFECFLYKIKINIASSITFCFCKIVIKINIHYIIVQHSR